MDNRSNFIPPNLIFASQPKETQNDVKQIPAKPSQSSTPTLHFLDGFNNEALSQLEKKYNKNQQELEDLVGQYWKSFRWEQTMNYGALGSNFLYMFFRGKTSNTGIENVADIIQPKAPVSNAVGYGLGVSLAVPGTLVFVFSSSAKNDAALAVLAYATSDSIDKRIKDALTKAANNKIQALFDSVKFVANQTVLISTYATSAISNIVPIIDYLNHLPGPGKWSIICFIQYFSYRYNTSYYNTSYYEGLQFWQNEKNRPYLLGEIWQGNISLPLEVFLQGIISAVGLRAFPNYYYSALAAAGAVGGWIPASIVTICAAIHSLCVLYPSTYNYYMTAHEEINAILKKNISTECLDKLLEEEGKKHNLSLLGKEDQEKLRQQLIERKVKFEREKISQHIHNEKGQLAVFKEEPSTLATVTLTTAIGACLGYKLAPLLVPFVGGPPALLTSACTILAASLIGGSFFKAEDTRINNNLVLKHLKKDESKKEQKESPPQTGYEKAAEITAGLLVVANAASSVASTSGSGKLVGGDSTQMNLGITTLALKGALNNIVYNFPKVKETLQSFAPADKKITNTPGTLFHSQTNKKEDDDDDWVLVASEHEIKM